ncbi:hypothetical protein Zmor_004482 [Zophobas morio]|jgi:hypothetical protein|uniref:Uncharacterized protein n=1 Tax=Zophobas morio TaxID=2755281 RepID=A0AA38HIY1_9CUCU|nr:hypothetical protein Zmor_004482 [Zophobas morio]
MPGLVLMSSTSDTSYENTGKLLLQTQPMLFDLSPYYLPFLASSFGGKHSIQIVNLVSYLKFLIKDCRNSAQKGKPGLEVYDINVQGDIIREEGVVAFISGLSQEYSNDHLGYCEAIIFPSCAYSCTLG